MSIEKFIFIGDIVESNGKTIRNNNLELKHKIPIGCLVETHSKHDYGWEGIRLFVRQHTRDCDGTPLYSLGDENHGLLHGFSEDCLKVVNENIFRKILRLFRFKDQPK